MRHSPPLHDSPQPTLRRCAIERYLGSAWVWGGGMHNGCTQGQGSRGGLDWRWRFCNTGSELSNPWDLITPDWPNGCNGCNGCLNGRLNALLGPDRRDSGLSLARFRDAPNDQKQNMTLSLIDVACIRILYPVSCIPYSVILVSCGVLHKFRCNCVAQVTQSGSRCKQG